MAKHKRRRTSSTAQAAPPGQRPAERQGRLASLRWPLVAVVALAIVAYVNALGNAFVLDDIPIIVENPVIRDLGNVGTMFTTNYWSRGGGTALGDSTLYRPLTVLSYALDYAIWSLSPVAFHAMNVALHAAVSALVLIVGTALLGNPAAFAAASIFAVHPVHTEAVTGVVGRAEVLATLFFLSAFWVLRRRSTFLIGTAPERTLALARALVACSVGALLYLLGLFSKESAVTLPALLALDDWVHREEIASGRSRAVALATRYGALALALVVYLVLRQQAVTGGSQIWPGFLGVPAGDRMLTASRVLMEYVGLFLFPRTLLADYWKTEVPIATLADPFVLLSLVLWIGIAVLAFTRLRRDVAFVLSAGWFFITVAPVSNFFFPIGVAKAERLLYLPSVGLCLLAGWAYVRAQSAVRSPVIPRIALAGALVALTTRTLVRNADWKNNYTLATATLAASPSSPLMNDIAAEVLVKRGDAKAAVPLLQEAVKQAPDMALIRSHLGAAYHAQGMLDQAIAEYQEAIRRHPNDADAHNNLGVAYLDKGGREQEAVAAFNEAVRRNPGSADPHINLGSLHLRNGRLSEATAEFGAAVQANPFNADAHNALGVAYARQGQTDRAAESYAQALRLDPAHAGARANLARLETARAAAPR